jgi:hypothetical protein
MTPAAALAATSRAGRQYEGGRKNIIRERLATINVPAARGDMRPMGPCANVYELRESKFANPRSVPVRY